MFSYILLDRPSPEGIAQAVELTLQWLARTCGLTLTYVYSQIPSPIALTPAGGGQQALRHNVKSNTVERLKQILTGFNEECYTNCTKSGKKQDLIDRITHEMDAWRNSNNVERWVKGRAIINQVRTTGWYVDAPSSYAPLDALALGCSSFCTSLLTGTMFV